MKITTITAILTTISLSTMTAAPASSTNPVGDKSVQMVSSDANGSSKDSGFHFQVDLSYVNGMDDLNNKIMQNNPSYSIKTTVPVGLSLRPSFGLGHGLEIGVDVGPAVLGVGDASFYIVPVGADVRYIFLPKKYVSPYVRLGVEYAIAGGDFIQSSSVGFVGAGGIEFGNSKHFSWGLEAGYNSSSVKVNAANGRSAKDCQPYEFTASLFVRF